MSTPIRSLFAMLLACAQAALGQQPQTDDQAIRLKAELVELRVVVTDKKGRVIDNLTRDDFEVVENGRPHPLSFFSVERVGAPAATASADPSAPRRPIEAPKAGAALAPARTIVLFVDDIHLNPSSLLSVKQHLKKFIDEKLTDQDAVAIVTTSGVLGGLQQFMRDRRLLKVAVDKITPRSSGQSLLTPYLASRITAEDSRAISLGLQILQTEEGFIPPINPEEYVRNRARQTLLQAQYLRRAALSTLRAACERLGQLPGQRLLVMLSEGFTMYEEGGSRASEDMRAVTGRAARAGVVIYSIDASGLTTPVEFQSSTPGGLSGNIDFSVFMAEGETDREATLKELADATGGRAFVNSNDLDAPLGRMLEENSMYYALAFYPEENKAKNKFHKISVRVKNHPEYEVRAQSGYMLSEPGAKEAVLTPRQKMLRAMLDPLPVTDIQVFASADFLAREEDPAQVLLQVLIDASRFTYAARDKLSQMECTVGVAVYDASGKVVKTFADTMKGDMSAEQVELAKRNGYRYSTWLELKPGLYQVRVGVLDNASATVGTAMSWVEVPDLTKKWLAVSSLFLGREEKDGGEKQVARQVGGEAGRANDLRMVLGRPTYRRGEMAHYRLVVYNAADEADTSMRVEIVRGAEKIFAGDWQPLAARTIRKAGRGIEVGGQLRLGLEPGLYELRLLVQTGKMKTPLERATTIEVEP